ncbi:calcium and calmodulin-dependent serine threonine-protein kinase-like protein [Trifolium pratense]|uniref:Calcium and calmodulin-dependent serine threonine-protein kinase-like protein n=1 Tax=Trifolium pratense TaxID=57577 RepID=A0A2K3JMK8_TRIPR|nr:calcium and calmodulin-dependent serine threonine-protein kinase-like protein [Trifolium pratense]
MMLYNVLLEQLLSDPWVKGEKAKDDQMDPEIVSRLQRFNARRKLRAAAIASVWSSTIFLRTKKLKSLVGSYDLKEDEIENLRIHFKKICSDRDNATLAEFEELICERYFVDFLVSRTPKERMLFVYASR